MCGISGFSWVDQGLIEAMNGRLAHRGPDASGFHLGQNATLGHTRLAIIDLSERGRQPMHNEDGRVHIVVNGEIYNHQDLRRELIAKGHVFTSDSDSEAVLHGYEEWGPAVIERLFGMFCFAVLDERQGRIMLGRDRLGGIKPLYYHLAGQNIIFSNEIKAILAWPGLTRRVDPQALYNYLGWEFTPAPQTLFAGINKLKQAHYAIFDLNSGAFSEHQYWDLKFAPAFSRPEEAVEELRSRIRIAVQRRLMSDVPLWGSSSPAAWTAPRSRP